MATAGTLASLVDLDANGGALTNYLAAQDTFAGNRTFVQSDSGREKIFTGSTAATWIGSCTPIQDSSTKECYNRVNLERRCADSFAASSTIEAVTKAVGAPWLQSS